MQERPINTGEQAGAFGELRQHWRVLPPCLAGITLCATHSYSLGVMIPRLEQEFGWLRAEISAGLLIIAMIAIVGAPLTGIAVERFGPRRIALAGTLFFCSALALLGTATADVTSWLMLWALLGVGNMLILPAVWLTAINGYYDKNRGIALAIALCGTGIAAAVVPSLTEFLVERFGWRYAYVALGAIGVLAVFPVSLILFREARGRPPANGEALPDSEPARQLPGVSAKKGFLMPSFIKLASAVALFSIAICALTTNAVPVLIAQGLSSAVAAGLAGLIGIGSIIGRIGGGLLLDRFNASKVAAFSVLLPIITVLLLLNVPNSAAAAGLACFILGLSVGTEVDCCAYLAARHFGMRSFGTLFGTINGMMLFGNGIAPVLANHVYDVTSSYNLVLWAQIPAFIGTALLFLWLGPYRNFEESEDESPVVPDGNPAT